MIFDNDEICCICREQLQNDEEMICAKCEARGQDAEREIKHEQDLRQKDIRARVWEKICPPGYKESKAELMPEKMQKHFETWNPSRPTSIYIKGPSGIGKTSAGFVFLRAAIFAGVRVSYWQASDLRQSAINASSGDLKFSRFKKTFLDAELIFLDDFGNTAKTASSDEHLLSLLEGVKSNGIKTITTTQYHGKQLVESFHNSSVGMAISNRLQNAARIDLFDLPELFN